MPTEIIMGILVVLVLLAFAFASMNFTASP